MSTLRLLCTDLDRTLIPNGDFVELPGVRQAFAHLISQYSVHLVYVSGRDRRRVQQVMKDYQLPYPAYVIADVGSTIYSCQEEQWSLVTDWHQCIKHDWAGHSAMEICHYFADIPAITLQESNKQGRYKLSFYVSLEIDQDEIKQQIHTLANQHHLAINFIYSIDDKKRAGLLDVLPASANKLKAIRYLMDKMGLQESEVLFAGDSGNDLDVLSSELPAVLVANAPESVRRQALRMAEDAGHRDQLYLAHGVTGNGHYADGIIEGVRYYFPGLNGRGK